MLHIEAIHRDVFVLCCAGRKGVRSNHAALLEMNAKLFKKAVAIKAGQAAAKIFVQKDIRVGDR